MNKTLSLANVALCTLNLFPRVIYIGPLLMVVAFTACISVALTNLCIIPESIKEVLQFTHSIFMGNSKVVTFSNGFHQIHKLPANENTKETQIFCLITTAYLYLVLPLLQFLWIVCSGLDGCGGAWLLWNCGLQDGSLAQQFFSLWPFLPQNLQFPTNFC